MLWFVWMGELNFVKAKVMNSWRHKKLITKVTDFLKYVNNGVYTSNYKKKKKRCGWVLGR